MTAEPATRPAAPVIPPGGPECSVVIPVPLAVLLPGFPGDGWSLERCGKPAVGRYIGRCPCGHVRDGWMCADCAAQMAGGCRACTEDPSNPHYCPVTLARAGVPGA